MILYRLLTTSNPHLLYSSYLTFYMIALSLAGPVVSSISLLVLSRALGSTLLRISLMLHAISTISVLVLAHSVWTNDLHLELVISSWSTLLSIPLAIQVTPTTVSLWSVISTVGTLVVCYSLYYMADDSMRSRFVGLLSAFIMYMSILALASNLAVLFIGWELIGLLSYLLIGYWADRPDASTSALSAMLTNKLGDYLLTVGLIIVQAQVGTLDLTVLNSVYSSLSMSSDSSLSYGWLIALGMIIASMAKSAQLGLHLWLIHAMAGPTPVSSLLHAATLVVAGPILLIKVSSLVVPYSAWIITIGIMTSLLGALLALIQQDVKGVIAYSTMSQFGYIISISTVLSDVALLHIATHGAFKASLFMAAGIAIHASQDVQDSRRYGGLGRLLPVAYLGTLVCSMSLIAIPYTAGSYSKDLILEVHAAQYRLSSDLGYTLGLIVAGLTAAYSVRLLVITYLGVSNQPLPSLERLHGPNLYAVIPVSVLTVLAGVLGYYTYGLIQPTDGLMIAELFAISGKAIPIMVVLTAVIVAWAWYRRAYQLGDINYRALALRLYWPTIYTSLYASYLTLASRASQLIDLGLLEAIGPRGGASLLSTRRS